MKLIRSREHTINMGSYESLKVGGSVELDEFDLAGELTYQQQCDLADGLLGQALEADLKEAIELLPPGSTSYVLSWRQNA